MDAKLARRAEAACRRSRKEIAKLGDELTERTGGGVDPIAHSLVIPGLKVLERALVELEPVEEMSASPRFELYVGLYSPILELGEQRIEAGETGEPERGHSLELLIAGIEDEQQVIARELRLTACSFTFTEALGGPQ